MNKKCPKCGSSKTKVTQQLKKHGFLWWVFIGVWVWLFKVIFAMTVFMVYDWWMAIIKKIQGKGHIWRSKKMMSNTATIYYCDDCGNNFKV